MVCSAPGVAAAGKQPRGQLPRCSPRLNRVGTTGHHRGEQPGCSLLPPDTRTAGCHHTAQDTPRPPAHGITLPSPGSVSNLRFLVFGLTPHGGPAGESCAGRAPGQHAGQSSGPQAHSGPQAPLGSTPTPLLPSPLPSLVVLVAAPWQLGRQCCARRIGPGSQSRSLWVMWRSRSTGQRCSATSHPAVFLAFPGHPLPGASASQDALLSTLITPSLLLGTLPPLLTDTCFLQHTTPQRSCQSLQGSTSPAFRRADEVPSAPALTQCMAGGAAGILPNCPQEGEPLPPPPSPPCCWHSSC